MTDITDLMKSANYVDPELAKVRNGLYNTGTDVHSPGHS
jgi:hypothetical protein